VTVSVFANAILLLAHNKAKSRSIFHPETPA
jgi:hypothetical protein